MMAQFDYILAWVFLSVFFIIGGFLLAMIGRTVYQIIREGWKHGQHD